MPRAAFSALNRMRAAPAASSQVIIKEFVLQSTYKRDEYVHQRESTPEITLLYLSPLERARAHTHKNTHTHMHTVTHTHTHSLTHTVTHRQTEMV